MQKLPEAVQLIEKASMMYLENGTPDTAAMALERAGKWVSGTQSLHRSRCLSVLIKSFENKFSISHVSQNFLSNLGL